MAQPQLDVFQVVADPSRRQMLHLLSQDSMTINHLASNFDMSRPAVSKHVRVLYMAGFISIEDIGRERYCSLKEDGFKKLQEWMAFYDNFWKNKLNQLGNILNQKNKKK